ncbi:hypothetical protein HF521_014180 [Silurus meridionalis]|uniref:Uncharacterized protein n=1 Tax=Silurus meridionalis TaxID=175797 RepID=A0A8T0AAV5_SILME|nr:hypothetical protein HF521_014180 [Silurus meridionalis]
MVYEDGKVFANEGNRLHLTNNNLKEPLNMASSSQEPKSTIEVEKQLIAGETWWWFYLAQVLQFVRSTANTTQKL